MVMVFIGTVRAMKANFFFVGLCFTLAVATASAPVYSKTYDVGTEEQVSFVEAKPTYNPAPAIPPEKHEQSFKSYCLARFHISADGKSKVKLVSSSGSHEIDEITLTTLRRWKFKPAMLDGSPVESTRRIKVEFEVN